MTVHEPAAGLLTPANIRLLSDIGFVAACSSQRERALQIFQALTLFRPLKAFPYLGLAVANLNAKRPTDALQALALGRRVLGSGVDSSPEIREDYAMLGMFEGVAAQADERRTEGLRIIAGALEKAPPDGAAARLGKRLLGVERSDAAGSADARRLMHGT
jgi:hypothetical protein